MYMFYILKLLLFVYFLYMFLLWLIVYDLYNEICMVVTCYIVYGLITFLLGKLLLKKKKIILIKYIFKSYELC